MFALLKDTYRILVEVTATDTGTGFYELTPMEQKLEWRWSKDNELGIWAKELATKLTFRNNAAKGIYDFDILKTEYESKTDCLQRDFIIQRKCGSGDFENFHHCLFQINKCRFQYDKCEVVVEVRNRHPLWCILDEQRGSNLLNADGDVYLSRFGNLQFATRNAETEGIGTQEEFVTAPPISDADINPANGWLEIQTSFVTFPGLDKRQTLWARAFSATLPPDIDHWIVVTGGWARMLEGSDLTVDFTRDQGETYYRSRIIYEIELFRPASSRPGDIKGLENGRYLEQILDMFIGFTNCQGMMIKSNFFNINTAGDTPDNEAYALAAYLFDTWKLAFWQITDIAVTTGTAATLSRITFLQFLTDLQKIFNLGFDFDEDTQTIIIEHISFFKRKRMMDFTRESLVKYIRGGHEFFFETDDIPSVEKFGWSQDFNESEFGMQIEYNGACTGNGNKEDKLYTERLYTDLRYISQKAEDFSSSDSIFMGLVDDAGVLVETIGNSRPNHLLSFPDLQILHYWERPIKQGYIFTGNNSVYSDFKTWWKTRTQIPLTVPLCCEDVNRFRPDIMVKSQLGWCEIKEATVSDPAPEIKVVLKTN